VFHGSSLSVEFDDVANDQRKVIYAQRNEIMEQDDVSDVILAVKDDVIERVVAEHIPPGSFHEQWHIDNLEKQLKNDFGVSVPLKSWVESSEKITESDVQEKVYQAITEHYQNKEKEITAEILRQVEKSILLSTLDTLWKDHLAAMDHLRQGIHLRGYAQKNPKQEYKREAFSLFASMLDSLRHDTFSALCLIQLQMQQDVDQLEAERRQQHAMHPNRAEGLPIEQGSQAKMSRNQACPCGSGKKYKHCHGKMA